MPFCSGCSVASPAHHTHKHICAAGVRLAAAALPPSVTPPYTEKEVTVAEGAGSGAAGALERVKKVLAAERRRLGLDVA